MTITEEEYYDWFANQVGKPCEKHGSIIKDGKYGYWCGNKDELGHWCTGNDYPSDGNLTIIRPTPTQREGHIKPLGN